MKPKAKRILITTETHEIVVIRHARSKSIRGFCVQCQCEVELLSIDSSMVDNDQTKKESLLTSEAVHLINASGRQYICQNSLARLFEKVQGDVQ